MTKTRTTARSRGEIRQKRPIIPRGKREIVDPYIIRITGENRQCRGLTVEVAPGKPTYFIWGRAPMMTWWVGSERLPDPYKAERMERVTADHIPGTDCFLEREPTITQREIEFILARTAEARITPTFNLMMTRRKP